MSKSRSFAQCDLVGQERVRPLEKDPSQTRSTFKDATNDFTEEQAMAEAGRCTRSNPCYTCSVCELMCPDLAITRGRDGSIVVDLKYCKGCGLCAHYCPKNAITMVVDE